MKYLMASYMNNVEKQEIESKGLYCYDLRHSDEGGKIATIEKNVLVNRIGSIITNEELKFGNSSYNDFIDFQEFSSKNTEVYTIEQLQGKQKEKVNENRYKVIIRKPNLNEHNKNFIQKSKLIKTANSDYPYNVQIWNSIDRGKSFCYTGNGKFFKTKLEAENYREKLKAKGIKKDKNKEREVR